LPFTKDDFDSNLILLNK